MRESPAKRTAGGDDRQRCKDEHRPVQGDFAQNVGFDELRDQTADHRLGEQEKARRNPQFAVMRGNERRSADRAEQQRGGQPQQGQSAGERRRQQDQRRPLRLKGACREN